MDERCTDLSRGIRREVCPRLSPDECKIKVKKPTSCRRGCEGYSGEQQRRIYRGECIPESTVPLFSPKEVEAPLESGRTDILHQSEVRSALSAADARPLNGIPAETAQAALKEQHQLLEQKTNEQTQSKIARLVVANRVCLRIAQLERVSQRVAEVVRRRRDQRERRHRESIYRHVSQHLKEVRDMCDWKDEQISREERMLQDALGREREVEELIRREAGKVGIGGEVELHELEEMLERLTSSD